MIIKVIFHMERVKETIPYENCKGGDGMKHFKNVQIIDFLLKMFLCNLGFFLTTKFISLLYIVYILCEQPKTLNE